MFKSQLGRRDARAASGLQFECVDTRAGHEGAPEGAKGDVDADGGVR